MSRDEFIAKLSKMYEEVIESGVLHIEDLYNGDPDVWMHSIDDLLAAFILREAFEAFDQTTPHESLFNLAQTLRIGATELHKTADKLEVLSGQFPAYNAKPSK